MKETVLIFHVTDKDTRLKLEMALFPLHVRIKYIEPKDCGIKLGALAGIDDIPKSENLYTGEDLPHSMLIFAFFNDDKLNRAINNIRKNGAGLFPYKAVLTQANRFWTPAQCLAELMAEHEALSGSRNN